MIGTAFEMLLVSTAVQRVRLVIAMSLALLTNLLAASAAHASLGACLSDPVVILSSGATIDLFSAIDDKASDVVSISYIVRIPIGLGVSTVLHTSGLLGPKETFQFVAGNAANTYNTTTMVSTGTSGLAVKVRTTVLALPHLPATASAAGTVNQSISVQIIL